MKVTFLDIDNKMAAKACRLLATSSRLLERVIPNGTSAAVSRIHQSCLQPERYARKEMENLLSAGYKMAHPMTIPQRHATWHTDKRISQNLGAVGVPAVDPEITPITDITEGQDLAHMINEEQAEQGRLFAVVYINKQQRKVTVEDILVVDTEFPPSVGDRIRFEKVIMVGEKNFTVLGQPLLSRSQVHVEGTVIEKTLSHNRIWSTYKRRKRFRRLKLFRDPHTMIVINRIELCSIPEE